MSEEAQMWWNIVFSLPGLTGPDLKGKPTPRAYQPHRRPPGRRARSVGAGAYPACSAPGGILGERITRPPGGTGGIDTSTTIEKVVQMGPEWIVVGVIAVAVLFGAKKIPEMARSVGRAQGEFKRGIREGAVDEAQAQPPAAAPAPQPPVQHPPSAVVPPPEPPPPPANGSPA
jgi:TatA/E family protein of Tat protein translocase